MAMRTKMNLGGGITLVYDRTGADETLREIMSEVAAKQKEELKKQEQELAKAQEALVKSEKERLKAEKNLEKEQKELEKEKKELEKEKTELSEIRAKTDALKKQHIEFEKRHVEFEKEKKLMASFSKKQDKFAAYIDEINKLAEKFTQQVLKRGELTSTLVAKIMACKENAELKGEKFVQQFAAMQTSFDSITREVDTEEAILDKVQENSQAYEAVLDEMKAELDELAVPSKPLYDKHVLSYERACRWLSNLKSKFDEPLAYKSKSDEIGRNCADILDALEERLEQEKLAAEKKDSSPSSSKSHTPPSDSEIVSSSDESGSLTDDLSSVSLSLPRKNSSSSDEEKEEKLKKRPIPTTSPTLSSSAMVGSLLPPAPTTVQSSSSLKADLKKETSTGQRSQAPTVAVSKASTPQQNKGLLAKLGFNKDKSTTQSPQQPPVAGSSASVTPGVTLQRNGLTTVR